jgi:mRNA interferase MazF
MHDHLRTVLAAPMTTGSKPAPFRIAVGFAGKDGLVLLDQIRALDKTRLIKKMGALPSATLTATLTTLQEVFAA